MEKRKNLVIGSGEGGKYLAWHLAAQGEATTVVERRWIGGSCPNINCLPSKNEIWSAQVAHLSGRPADMAAVLERKRAMVTGLVQMHLEKFHKTGAELVMGSARLLAPGRVQVDLNEGGVREYGAERVFLNLGTHAAIPPTPGLAESSPLTHVEILELDRLPEHLVVLGGGYVGLEFAQAYRRFGSRVTVVQRGGQLLKGADQDVAEAVRKFLESEGIEVLLGAEVRRVSRSGDRVSLQVGDREVVGSDILVAAGRIPNTTGMGLVEAGIQLDAQGYVAVNDRLETSLPGIWAIGECAGSPQFTHASLDDFRIIRDNLAGGNRSSSDRLMPSCLFTHPQVAQVGLSEGEARARGIAYRLAKIPAAAVLRTRTSGETVGFLKALVDAEDRILGFTMVGPEAGEVAAVVQVAMMAGFSYRKLADAVLTHPTMAEGLNVLFSAVPG